MFTAGSASDVDVTKLLPTVNFCTHDCTTAGMWVATGSSGTFYAKNDVSTLYLYDEDGNQLGYRSGSKRR